MSVPAHKLTLICWAETAQQYGYGNQEELTNQSKVVVRCSACRLPRLHTSVGSMRVRSDQKRKGQTQYTPICPQCQQKRTWAQNPEFRQHQTTVQSTAMKQVWNQPGYRQNQAQKHSIISTELWQNQEYRTRVSQAIADKHASDPTYTTRTVAALQTDEATARRLAAVSTPEYRQAMKAALLAGSDQARDRSLELWQDPEFRAAVTESNRLAWQDAALLNLARTRAIHRWQQHRDSYLARFNDPEHIELLRQNAQLLWQDREFKTLHSEAMNDPAYLEFASRTAIALWQDPEYRQKQAAAAQDPTVIARRSAASKLVWEDSNYRERIAQARANQPRVSSIQRMLYKLLGDLDIPFHEEGAETAVGHYVFDCMIPKRGGGGLLIECQGEYWHSLPQAAARDRAKFTYVDRHFPEYEVMYLWEHEFYASDRVLDRLKLKLGLEIPVAQFTFQQIQVREIAQADQVREFLDAYHYIGKGRGGKSYGAYHHDQLVGVAVYSPPLRQNTAGQFQASGDQVRELSRFCIHPSYHKKNFASWFIAQSLRRLQAELVIAYADTTAGHQGTIYAAAGFQLHHAVDPDYWYVDQEGFVMHKRTLYGRARRLGMSERHYAEAHGYFKKWGGAKHCFVLDSRGNQ